MRNCKIEVETITG